MKRILSLILTLCIIGTCFSFTAVVSAADESAVTPLAVSAFDFLSALEIMVGDEEGNANLDKNMSRAEFAQLITNILKYSSKTAGEEDLGGFFDETIWQENFFGEDTNFDELLYPSEEEEVAIPGYTADFEDVSTAHWAYDAVKFVREIGIMNGTSATTFNPDGQVRTNEVIKCLMVMLGYKSLAEVNGGYPSGYLKFAQRLNLTNGAPAGEFCTRAAIAIILKNAMDANILLEASYGENGDINFQYDENRTLATDILGLRKVDGIMTDNGYTTILGDSSYEGGKIVVDGKLFRVPEGKAYAEFIGRDVTCWYTNYKSNDPGVVAYVEVNNRDMVTVVDGETVTSVSDGNINYKVNKTSRKVNYEGAYVILNGVAQTTYDETIFDIEYGTITVIETNNDLYKKVVVIDEFETWFVSNVDKTEMVIYNSLRDSEYAGAEDIMALDFEDPQYIITIYNADGTVGDFDSIQKNSVLDVIRLGKVFKIYVTNSVITDFKVKEIIEDRGKTFLSDGENTFEVTSAFMNYPNREEFALNTVLTVYLNSKNRVAWAVNQAKSGLNIGYILEIGNRSDTPISKQYGMQMYTATGAHTLYDLADIIRVSDHNGEESKMTEKEFNDAYAAEFNAVSNVYDGICRYTVDDNDEINYIELPILNANTKINGKLHRILYADTTSDRNGYFGANSFNAKVLTSTTNTKVIRVNPDFRRVEDEKAFSIGTTSGLGNSDIDDSSSGYIYRAYTDVEGSAFAKYLILKSASKASGLDTYSTLPNVYVVTKIAGGRFPDDTLGTVITGRRIKNGSSADETLYIKSDAVVDTEAQTATRATDHNGYINELFPGGISGIELGDIIRVGKDTEGLVDKIRVVWDEDGLDASADPTQTPGASPFMNRYWEAASAAPKYNCVPFGYHGDPSKSMQFYPGNYFRVGSFRVLAGFPLKIRESGVRITTWDVVANGFDELSYDSRYADETWAISRVYVVNFKDGEVTVKSGSASDIKTYEEFGTNCSRIINVARYGTISCMIVYNSYSEN